MKIQIKRAYDNPSENDGYRILVDRLWPRGISKEKAIWIILQPDLLYRIS
jgi:uncharacterized protein YeaO (DUF488 family)